MQEFEKSCKTFKELTLYKILHDLQMANKPFQKMLLLLDDKNTAYSEVCKQSRDKYKLNIHNS